MPSNKTSNDKPEDTGNKQADKQGSEQKATGSGGKQSDKSSEDHTSRTKAGSTDGAGGGAKQKQNH